MASMETTPPEVGCEIHYPRPVESRNTDVATHGSDTPSTVSDDAMHDGSTTPVDAIVPLQTSGATDHIGGVSPPSEGQNEGTKSRSSRYRGVCWNKKNKRWQAAINNGGRYIYLGSFTSDVDAAKAFDLAALQIRGRNTKLNFSVDSYTEEEWKSGPPPHLAEKYMSGTARPKTQTFRDFPVRPMKKLHPSQFAAIHLPAKRSRFEDCGLSKKAFDRAEQRFLNNDFINPSVSGQPRIKQEYPAVQMSVVEPSFKKIEGMGTPFDKSPFYYIQGGISSSPIQPPRPFKTPSITTPPVRIPLPEQTNLMGMSMCVQFGSRAKDVFDQSRGFSRSSDVTFGGGLATDRMDDSAERTMGYGPIPSRAQQIQTCPVPQPIQTSSTTLSDRLPVPVLQSAQDDPSLHVSSVISETVAGSDIEEAKVIVGSSRNQFGLIHRMVNNSKWNALVWDGTTMHSMGVYVSEEDAQVACSSAVRLVETILTRSNTSST